MPKGDMEEKWWSAAEDDTFMALIPKYKNGKGQISWKNLAAEFNERMDKPRKSEEFRHRYFRLKQEGRNLSRDYFRPEIDAIADGLAWTEGSWDLAPGMTIPWKEIQNTNRHIDLVTNYLIRSYRNSALAPVIPGS